MKRLTSEKTLEISLPDKETLKGRVITPEDGTIILKSETGPTIEFIRPWTNRVYNIPPVI